MRALARLLVLSLALAACEDPIDLDDSSEAHVVDVRVTDEDIGALGPEQIVLDGGEFEVAAGTDTMMCVFGTYTGPTIGLNEIYTYQGKYGHHLQILGTALPEFEHPDGEIIDCTGEGGFSMVDLEPIGIPNAGSVDGAEMGIALPLPAGMAVELESGQRYVLQSHYLNSSPDPILVRDRLVLTTIAADEVEQWAAPVVLHKEDFRIPAGQALTESFVCEIDRDLNMLYADGHMHEWGTSFQVDILDGDARTPFYSVPEWDPVYRDAPLVLDRVDEPMFLPAGTTFETTCSWFNDTDEDLVFPHEMCDTVMIVYPLQSSWICSP